MRVKSLIAAAVVAISLSGCLTIEENYFFDKTGGGSLEYIVDLSAFGEMMESMSEAMKEIDVDADVSTSGANDAKSMAEGFKGFGADDQKEQLEKINGISKVKVKEEEYKSVVSFKFTDIVALNNALNVLMPDSTGDTHTFFLMENGVLKRRHNHRTSLGSSLPKNESTEEIVDGGTSADADSSGLDMLRSMKYIVRMKGAYASTSSTSDRVDINQEKRNLVVVKTDMAALQQEPEALNLSFSPLK